MDMMVGRVMGQVAEGTMEGNQSTKAIIVADETLNLRIWVKTWEA